MDGFSEDICLISKELSMLPTFNTHLSDTETICSSCSCIEFSSNYDQEMDNQLEKFAFDAIKEPEKQKKKRGRKPLRPNDPIKKKTEIKDKYWLRAFRNFIKIHLSKLIEYFDEESLKFWNVYISKLGKPGKDSQFLSYGKSYKAFLFGEKTFASVFKGWFLQYGETELLKKYKRGSDLWFIYFDYALQEIAKDGVGFVVYEKVFNKKEKREVENKKVEFLFDDDN